MKLMISKAEGKIVRQDLKKWKETLQHMQLKINLRKVL